MAVIYYTSVCSFKEEAVGSSEEAVVHGDTRGDSAGLLNHPYTFSLSYYLSILWTLLYPLVFVSIYIGIYILCHSYNIFYSYFGNFFGT